LPWFEGGQVVPWTASDVPSGATSGDPIGWINYGVMGLIILGLITGLFWVKPSVDNLKAERDRALVERDKATGQRDEMASTFQKELLPTLTKFLTTTEALLPVLQRMVDKMGPDQR
jgi:hypothetical protein